jgi:hypothetical protein
VACRQLLRHEHLQINVPVRLLLLHRQLTAQGEMNKHGPQTPAMVRKIVWILEGGVKSTAMKGR